VAQLYKSVQNFWPIYFDLVKLTFIVQHHFIATKHGIKPTWNRKNQLFCLQVESSHFSRKSSTLSGPQVTSGLSGIRWADWSESQA